MGQWPPVHLVSIHTQYDDKGTLSVIEGDSHIPFAFKRVFWIFDVPSWAERGGHAHKKCEQVLIALQGQVVVEVDDNNMPYTYILSMPSNGLYIPPGTRVKMCEFSQDCILLVLASEHFDEHDYVKENNQIS